MKIRNFFLKKSFPAPDRLQGVDAYELLSNSLPLGVTLIDPEYHVLRSNRQMREWFPTLDLSGPQKCFCAFNAPPRSKPCSDCVKHHPLSGGSPKPFLRQVRTATGFRTLKLKNLPLLDSEGKSHGFLEIAEDVTDQKTRETLQSEHLKFLELITQISAQIINIHDENWDGFIHAVLRQLGEFFAVDRCGLFNFNPDTRCLTNTHEWCAADISSQIEFMQDIPESAMPWWVEQLCNLRPIHYQNIHTLPPEAALEKKELLRQDIQSILYFPLEDEHHRCIGCMGFDAVRGPHFWHEDQISMLNVFTAVLTGALLRKKSRDDLIHRERQYRQLVTNSVNGVLSLELICDVDGTPLDLHILSANPSCCKILNRTAEQLLNHKASDEFPDLSTPQVLKYFSRVVRTSESQTFQMTTSDQVHHLDLSAYPLHGLRFAVVIADNTAREHAMHALKTKTDELSSYFHSSLDMLCILSQEGRFIEVNPEWDSVLGYDPVELAGKSFHELVPEQDQPQLLSFLKEALHRDQTLDLSLRILHAEGSLRWLELRARSIGSLLYAAARDVTARKLAEEEHIALQQQLNQALKMESIGRLAGGVAHDFNNTLQVILGNSEMALNFQNPSPTLKGTLLEIRDAAKRSSTLTRQLLAFARKQNIEPRELNLNDTLQGMMKMLKRLIGEQILLEWRLSEHIWPVYIDPGQVDQILANLCVNASDAIEAEGSIFIETMNETLSEEQLPADPDAKTGDYVKLMVRDTGCGIPPELYTKIFEPFLTTKPEGKGTGLGLATVHGIVLQNNGFVTVDSTVGQGTCFSIYLPRHQSSSKPAKANKNQHDLINGTEQVLIVEDEPMILQMTKLTLNKLGYKTHALASPLDALTFAENPENTIDLLLTDVVMPDMDGKELSNRIQALRPGIKTLYMSGYTNETMSKYGILGSGVPFIQKPFTVAAISQKLRSILDSPAS